jgi:hypothetical protein
MSTIGAVALGLAALFALTVIAFYPAVLVRILQILGGTFLLVLGLTLVALLVIAITGFDPMPLIRGSAVFVTQHQVVNLFDIVPPGYRVEEVSYEDTDGDGVNEWVVFYQFDLVDGRSPYGGVVYDDDRGRPPVLFPYQLLPPDRDYLSQGKVRLARADVVSLGEIKPVKELLVYGQTDKLDTELGIFRNFPNTLPWEPPTDDPRRYQVIGFFRGDAGVTYNDTDKTVTVRNRAGYDRSQLAVQTVYALNDKRGTYMSPTDPDVLGAPASTQVVFAYGMPDDILITPYPEKVVLAFYMTLGERPPKVPPRDFLTGQALIEYERNNLNYFGLQNATKDNISNVQIKLLSYVPEVEEFDASTTILGPEPRAIIVAVDLEARVGQVQVSTAGPIQWVLTLVDGKWRLDHRS